MNVLQNPIQRITAQRDLAILIAFVATFVAVCALAALYVMPQQRAVHERIHRLPLEPPYRPVAGLDQPMPHSGARSTQR